MLLCSLPSSPAFRLLCSPLSSSPVFMLLCSLHFSCLHATLFSTLLLPSRCSVLVSCRFSAALYVPINRLAIHRPPPPPPLFPLFIILSLSSLSSFFTDCHFCHLSPMPDVTTSFPSHLPCQLPCLLPSPCFARRCG